MLNKARAWIGAITKNHIKNKLIADCSQCDALCCNAPSFETPTYKKAAGVQCKNLDSQTLKCQTYDTREALGYGFCVKFDCHGAGQAVTKLFRNFGRNWQNDKTIAKIQYDVFIATYLYLSRHFFPDRKIEFELDQNTEEKLTPFVDKAINTLGNELNENLGLFLNKSLKRIKNKLIADCSQCDALCCNAIRFETPTYKKAAGVQCKNLDSQTLKCQTYDTREALGYGFCVKFDCHGAGQAVTKLFRNFGRNWQNDKTIAKIQYDTFVYTYLYLSRHFFPDQEVQVEVDQNTEEKLTPFVEGAIDILGKTLDETL